jgi:AcrR family transcriptional regulator
MSPPTDLRARKRLATRQSISDAATRLFLDRGFDHVTVDDIASAADVGRMTVFNHFPRKEDMFFDRDEEGRAMLRTALSERAAGVAPIEALRLLAHRLVADKHPAVDFSARSDRFILTVEASDTLLARARAIRSELAQMMTAALADSAGRAATDPDAELAAGLLLATWTVALTQAHRSFRLGRDTAQASAVFLAAIDKGSAGITAALADTPYVQALNGSTDNALARRSNEK